MESGYYPPGTEFKDDAPYNQVDLPAKEIEVTINLALSKTVKVKVGDYKVIDHYSGGHHYVDYDYRECDTSRAVEEQVVLPHNLAAYVKRIFKSNLRLQGIEDSRLNKAVSDCEGWSVEEMEIIEE